MLANSAQIALICLLMSQERISTPKQLAEVAKEVFGSNWGWQSRMARSLNVNSSTVRRWLSGVVAIPGPVSSALLCLKSKHRKQKGKE